MYLNLSQDMSHSESQLHRDPLVEKLVEELRDRVAFLERELERRDVEADRYQQIVAGLTQTNNQLSTRLRELEAPQVPPETSESVVEELFPRRVEAEALRRPESALGGKGSLAPELPRSPISGTSPYRPSGKFASMVILALGMEILQDNSNPESPCKLLLKAGSRRGRQEKRLPLQGDQRQTSKDIFACFPQAGPPRPSGVSCCLMASNLNLVPSTLASVEIMLTSSATCRSSAMFALIVFISRSAFSSSSRIIFMIASGSPVSAVFSNRAMNSSVCLEYLSISLSM